MTVKTEPTLRASVCGSSINQIDASVEYVIAVELLGHHWQVKRRFSCFDQLLYDLEWDGHAILPPLPPKTLLQPSNPSMISQRASQLQTLLYTLLGRQDVRQSEIFRRFLRVDEKHAIQGCKFDIDSSIEEGKFSIESFYYDVPTKKIYTAHADTTALSRLGRMWVVIESDELGAYCVWTPSEELKIWANSVCNVLCYKITCLCTHGKTVLLGLDSGRVVSYHMEESGTRQLISLELHGTKPVVDVCCIGDRLYSVGLDHSLRVYDLNTDLIISGGKLGKRLSGSQFLKRVIANRDHVAYVATSTNEIFKFDASHSPKPELVDTIRLPEGSRISDINLVENDLFVSHDSSISRIDLNGARSLMVSIPFATISRICVSPNTTKLAFGTADGAIGVASILSGMLCVASRTGVECSVTCLQWVDDRTVICSADDGRLRFWKMTGEIILDEVPGEIGFATTCSEVISRSTPVISAVLGGNSSMTLAVDDTDDDSWKKGIFS